MAVTIVGQKHTFEVGAKVKIYKETDYQGNPVQKEFLDKVLFITAINGDQVSLENCPFTMEMRNLTLC